MANREKQSVQRMETREGDDVDGDEHEEESLTNSFPESALNISQLSC